MYVCMLNIILCDIVEHFFNNNISIQHIKQIVMNAYQSNQIKLCNFIHTVCEDHPEHCDFYWSRGWFTCKIGGALWEYCPKSCGFCGDADAPGNGFHDNQCPLP